MNKKFYTVTLAFFLIMMNTEVKSQSQFEMVVYGQNTDEANAIAATSDGGFVVAGSTKSYGVGTSANMYIIKFDANGNNEWDKVIGTSTIEIANSIIQTSDGGYAITGVTFANNYGIVVLRLNENGDLQWSKAIPITQEGFEIIQTNDGGLAITGFVGGGGGIILIKLSNNGLLEWASTSTVGWQSGSSNQGHSLVQANDGSFLVAGWTTETFANGERDIYVVKFNSSGEFLWSKAYGGAGEEQAFSIEKSPDGGFVIAGSTTSFGQGGSDFYIIKINADGDILWTRSIGGDKHEVAHSIKVTSDGGYIVAGYTYSFGTSATSDFANAYIVKLDPIGNVEWTSTVGTFGNGGIEVAYSIIQTNDGGYVFAGQVFLSYGQGLGSIYIVKIGENGSACNNNLTTGGTSSSGGTAIAGNDATFVTGAHADPITLNVGSGGFYEVICTGTATSSSFLTQANIGATSFPNPFHNKTTIEFQLNKKQHVVLKVYDILGNEITTLADSNLLPDTHKFEFDALGLPIGIYIYKLKLGHEIKSGKLILSK